jgi:lipoprotein-releasing system permease protein
MKTPSKRILWFAWRQLRAKKGYGLSVMTWVSIFGVIIGVAAIVLVLSVMGGLARDIKHRVSRGYPHLEIYGKNQLVGFSLQQVEMSLMQKIPGLSSLEVFTKADCVIRHKKQLAPVVVFGLNSGAGDDIWGFSKGMVEGSLDHLYKPDPFEPKEHHSLPTVIVGEDLAIRLGINKGDVISVLNPQAGIGQISAGVKLVHLFKVRGTFLTLLPRYDNSYVLVDIVQGRKFMPDYDHSIDGQEYVNGIALMFENFNLAKKFKDKWPDHKRFSLFTWEDTNSSLLMALKLEKYTMSAILFLIILIAGFSISATLMMTVFHRQKYIAIIRSLGMSSQDVLKVYITHGCFIGIIGIFLGLILGIAGCLFLNNLVSIVSFLPSFLRQSVVFLPFEYAVICVSAFFISILASVYPAWVAASKNPSEGLQYI